MSLSLLRAALSESDTFEVGTVVRWRQGSRLFTAVKVDSDQWRRLNHAPSGTLLQLAAYLDRKEATDVEASTAWAAVNAPAEGYTVTRDQVDGWQPRAVDVQRQALADALPEHDN